MLAHFNEWRLSRRWRAIKRAQHRSPDRDLSLAEGRLGRLPLQYARLRRFDRPRRRRGNPGHVRTPQSGFPATHVQAKPSEHQLDFVEMFGAVDDLEDFLYVVVREFHAAPQAMLFQ